MALLGLAEKNATDSRCTGRGLARRRFGCTQVFRL